MCAPPPTKHNNGLCVRTKKEDEHPPVFSPPPPLRFQTCTRKSRTFTEERASSTLARKRRLNKLWLWMRTTLPGKQALKAAGGVLSGPARSRVSLKQQKSAAVRKHLSSFGFHVCERALSWKQCTHFTSLRVMLVEKNVLLSFCVYHTHTHLNMVRRVTVRGFNWLIQFAGRVLCDIAPSCGQLED